MKRKEPVTIFKVRLTNEGRQFWALVKILLFVGGMIGMVGVTQYWFCRKEYPNKTFKECVAP